MDLNKLYFDHQILLIRAQRAATPAVRHRHKAEAALIAGRIRQRQVTLGAAVASTRGAEIEGCFA
jgi:hypothetical protein